MEFENVFFTGHAIQRMFERSIDEEDVLLVIKQGEVIENYPDDIPFSSCLILGDIGGKPLHVVTALDTETRTCHVVTVYNPDSELWEPDFKKRKRS